MLVVKRMQFSIESVRFFRKFFSLSQAASADSSNWRSDAISNSAGGMFPIDSNYAAIDEINANSEMPMMVRQVKYLNIEEQGHRAVKLMLGFKSFQPAKNILTGIELMHMIRKGQISIAEQFYALAE